MADNKKADPKTAKSSGKSDTKPSDEKALKQYEAPKKYKELGMSDQAYSEAVDHFGSIEATNEYLDGKIEEEKVAARKEAEQESLPEVKATSPRAGHPVRRQKTVTALKQDRGRYGAYKFDFKKGDKVTADAEIAEWLIRTNRCI